MINTTDEKILLESGEPAFMVLGATSCETPGDTPDTPKKTTAFTIRINKALGDRLDELTARFYGADRDSDDERAALDALMRFRGDICERVCSRHAEFTRVNDELAVIIWRRVELKGGKKRRSLKTV